MAENTYKIGGSWGNRIEWLNTTQFQIPNTSFQVVGWKPRRPRVGDFLIGKFEKGTARFQFTTVELERDPPDMFFGEVAFIGYVDKSEDH